MLMLFTFNPEFNRYQTGYTQLSPGVNRRYT